MVVGTLVKADENILLILSKSSFIATDDVLAKINDSRIRLGFPYNFANLNNR